MRIYTYTRVTRAWHERICLTFNISAVAKLQIMKSDLFRNSRGRATVRFCDINKHQKGVARIWVREHAENRETARKIRRARIHCMRARNISAW